MNKGYDKKNMLDFIVTSPVGTKNHKKIFSLETINTIKKEHLYLYLPHFPYFLPSLFPIQRRTPGESGKYIIRFTKSIVFIVSKHSIYDLLQVSTIQVSGRCV